MSFSPINNANSGNRVNEITGSQKPGNDKRPLIDWQPVNPERKEVPDMQLGNVESGAYVRPPKLLPNIADTLQGLQELFHTDNLSDELRKQVQDAIELLLKEQANGNED